MTERIVVQETGRHAGTLTLKWRHRGSGWGRSSSSCPMPNPLLNPQLNNPSQVSLLGTTLMNLLKKNIAEPFQLTLLNIGVTNLMGVKGGAAGGVALLPLLPYRVTYCSIHRAVAVHAQKYSIHFHQSMTVAAACLGCTLVTLAIPESHAAAHTLSYHSTCPVSQHFSTSSVTPAAPFQYKLKTRAVCV